MLFNSPKIDIPFEISSSWQASLNAFSDLFETPVCVILKLAENALEVVVTNNNRNEYLIPYVKLNIQNGSLLEQTIHKNGLVIENELQKDVSLKDIFTTLDNLKVFMGHSILLKNGNIYGIICVLDNKSANITEYEKAFFNEIRKGIEKDLKILRQDEILKAEIEKREKVEQELITLNETHNNGLEKRHSEIDSIRKSLHEVEENYKLIVENQNALIVKFDQNYKLTYISPQYAHVLGTNTKELMEQSFFPYIHPDDIENVKRSLENLKKPPYVCSHEERLQTKTGWKWFSWSNKSVIGENGEIKEVVAVGRDIHIQKQSEFALKESEERYALALKGANDGLWDQNLKTGEIYYSERWKSMLGYKDNELENNVGTFQSLLHPEDKERVWSHKSDYIIGKIPRYEVEFRVQHKDGHWVNIYSRGFKVMDPDNGEVLRIVGTHLDVTNLRKTEQALKESEDEFRRIIELNSIPMAVTDSNQDMVILNKSFIKVFGYTIDEIPTAELWWQNAYPDPDYRKKVQTEWNAAAEEAMRTNSEIKSQIWEPTTKDGTKKVVEFSFVSIGKHNILAMVDLTDLKKAEQALIESEEKNRAFSEASDEALIFSDKGFCIECNLAAYKMFGYNEGELIGIFGTDVIADESKELVRQNMMSGYEEPYEAIAVKKDGKKFWAEFHGKMFNYKGKKVRVTAIRNISKRKKAEEALIFSEEKFRAAFKTSPDSVNINRLHDGLYIEINDGFTWLTGYTEEDVKGKTSMEINIWVNADDRNNLVNELKQKGYCTNLEAEFRMKSGEIVTALMSARIIELDGEKYIISMTRDIRQLKIVQNELLKAKDLAERKEKDYKQLFNEMLDGFAIHQVIYNESGHPVDYLFIDINPAYEKLTGLKHDKVVNKTVLEVLPNIEKHWIDNFGKVGKTGEPFWFEDYVEELDRYYNGLVYSPQQDYFAVIFSDVTDKKRAEKILLDNDRILKEQNEEYLSLNEELTSLNLELMEAKEKAVESDKLKTAFLTNMSHEIRTPMNGIMGFSGLLTKPDLEEEKKHKYIEIIHQNSNQLLSIINDLVEISKIEAGHIDIEKSEVALDMLTKSLFDLFSLKANEKKISLKLENRNFDIEIISDETKLRQILVNLLDNAFKFTSEGEVRFGYQLKGGMVEFFVSDTGIGIHEKAHKLIFERFRQVEITSARKYGGTGLGLSISKAYVQKLGGKIWLESSINKGAIFYFNLPLVQVKKNIKTPNNENMMDLNKINWSHYTILIAEDEVINYQFFEEILEDTRVNIIWVTNGQEAVNYCEKNNEIDLVLMDIKMPVLNGYDATRIIKKYRPDLPIIAQTAYALVGDDLKAREAGCDDYIYKPINVANLIKKISKFLK